MTRPALNWPGWRDGGTRSAGGPGPRRDRLVPLGPGLHLPHLLRAGFGNASMTGEREERIAQGSNTYRLPAIRADLRPSDIASHIAFLSSIEGSKTSHVRTSPAPDHLSRSSYVRVARRRSGPLDRGPVRRPRSFRRDSQRAAGSPRLRPGAGTGGPPAGQGRIRRTRALPAT